MKVVKVTSKGQVTIPVELRSALGIGDDSYLEVIEADGELRMRKIGGRQPLSDEDPIWSLVGAARSGHGDIAEAHDQHLAAGELARWRESS
ncbi:MAG: AbrB/MazE/SpoVT family DNA-binding domain-containing protein [Thermoanaerobaculia bacterium]